MSVAIISDVFGWGWFWQSSLCLALGLLGSLLLQRHAARAHQVLRLGMVAALLVPLLSLVVREQDLGILPPAPTAQVQPTEEPLPVVSSPVMDSFFVYEYYQPVVSTESVAKPQSRVLPDSAEVIPVVAEAPKVSVLRSLPWRQICLFLWPVVGLVFLFRLARTFVLGMRLLHSATPCENERLHQAAGRASTKLSVHVDVTIKESEAVSSPVIWCWCRRPVLLVPRDITRAGETDWVGVFCHELAHWKRRDHYTGLGAELWLCVFWWHPLVWWMRQRLEFLCEQACDDWVLASGQSAPDYAELLLELTPEARMACLPSIVGKDKTMKDRILRIVKNQSSSPRVGWQWAVLVCLLTSFFVVGTAFAQRRAPRRERDRDREHVEQRHEEAQELREEMAETEEEIKEAIEELQELKEEGEGNSEEARELQREIRELKREMQKLKREMQAMGRGRRHEHEDEDEDEPHEELREEIEEIEEELEEAVDELHELEEEDEGDSKEAQGLRREIRKLEQHLGKLRREMQAIDRRRQEGEHDRPQREEQLHREMQELERVMHRCEMALEELAEKGREDSKEAHKIREKQEVVHREMEQIHRMLEGRREVGHARELEARRRELAAHQRELQQRSRHLEMELKHLRDEHPEKAKRIHDELKEIHLRLEHVEHERHALRREHPQPDPQPRPHEARRRQVELKKKAEEIHRNLREMGDRHPERAEHLERVLHEIHAQMEEIERSFHDRPEPERRDLEGKVHELNERVDDLGNEMREIRALLEQLVRQQRGRLHDIEIDEEERRGRSRRGRRAEEDHEDDDD